MPNFHPLVLGLLGAENSEISEKARQADAVVVTKYIDFVEGYRESSHDDLPPIREEVPSPNRLALLRIGTSLPG
jgi:hypothetical protein